MSGTIAGRAGAVSNVTKKDKVRKHFCRSLVRAPDRKTWRRQVFIVLRPIVMTVAVMNHVVYMMADGGGEMLVRAI